jgi:hypothetical protein
MVLPNKANAAIFLALQASNIRSLAWTANKASSRVTGKWAAYELIKRREHCKTLWT